MRHIFAASIVLAGFGIVAIAAAEDSKVPGKPGPGKSGPGERNFPSPEQIKQKLIERFDANRDGRLSEQEQLQAQEFMRRQGVMLPGVGPGGGFPGAAEFMKRFDANGDGQLSDQEKFAAQAAFQKMRQQGAGGAGVGPGGFPTEGNVPPGAIPADETAKGKPEKGSALVRRFDKDGDGKLNAEEKAAAQAELKKSKTKSKEKSTKVPADKDKADK